MDKFEGLLADVFLVSGIYANVIEVFDDLISGPGQITIIPEEECSRDNPVLKELLVNTVLENMFHIALETDIVFVQVPELFYVSVLRVPLDDVAAAHVAEDRCEVVVARGVRFLALLRAVGVLMGLLVPWRVVDVSHVLGGPAEFLLAGLARERRGDLSSLEPVLEEESDLLPLEVVYDVLSPLPEGQLNPDGLVHPTFPWVRRPNPA